MPEIEPYYSDAEVARLLDPSGQRIKPRSIRSERASGRLVGTRVAGKWMFRKSDVLAFLDGARKCQEPTADPASSPSVKQDGAEPFSTFSGPKPAAASGTERVFLPPILTRRRTISEDGKPRAPERAEAARVIPIRSDLPT